MNDIQQININGTLVAASKDGNDIVLTKHFNYARESLASIDVELKIEVRAKDITTAQRKFIATINDLADSIRL